MDMQSSSQLNTTEKEIQPCYRKFSRSGLALLWGRYIPPLSHGLEKAFFSPCSPKQGHEMPRALQKQNCQKQCRFHSEHFQPALSSARQMQPSQRTASECWSSFSACKSTAWWFQRTPLNSSVWVSLSILKVVVSIHRSKSNRSLLIFRSYTHILPTYSRILVLFGPFCSLTVPEPVFFTCISRNNSEHVALDFF